MLSLIYQRVIGWFRDVHNFRRGRGETPARSGDVDNRAHGHPLVEVFDTLAGKPDASGRDVATGGFGGLPWILSSVSRPPTWTQGARKLTARRANGDTVAPGAAWLGGEVEKVITVDHMDRARFRLRADAEVLRVEAPRHQGWGGVARVFVAASAMPDARTLRLVIISARAKHPCRDASPTLTATRLRMRQAPAQGRG